jgi:hypothetical protein
VVLRLRGSFQRKQGGSGKLLWQSVRRGEAQIGLAMEEVAARFDAKEGRPGGGEFYRGKLWHKSRDY